MKGLLRKDFYMILLRLWAWLLVFFAFTGYALFNRGSSLFLYYPCLLYGIVPAVLLTCDERDKWQEYGETMPYSRAASVSSKYVVGLCMHAAQLALALLIRSLAKPWDLASMGYYEWFDQWLFMAAGLFAVMSAASLLLPLLFAFGTKKCGIFYWIAVVVFCFLGIWWIKWGDRIPFYYRTTHGVHDAMIVLLFVGSYALYALSWYLSVLFYRRRKIG